MSSSCLNIPPYGLGEWTTRSALAGDRRVDVAIIGGGFVGVITSVLLAQRGMSVALLERGHVGGEASGRNGGQLHRAYSPSMDKIEQVCSPEDARLLWDVAECGRLQVLSNITDHRIACGFKSGLLHVGLTPRHRRENEATAEEWTRYGFTGHSILDTAEVRQAVASERYTSALRDPGGGHLDPLAYVRAMAMVAEAAGVTIFENTPALSVTSGGGGVRVQAAGGRIDATHAVVAANAWIDHLIPRLRPRIMPVTTGSIATKPMDPSRAQAVIPSGMAISDLRVVLDYFRLDDSNRLLFGGGVAYSGVETPGMMAILRAKMLKVFPQLHDVEIGHQWTGTIDISLNRLPDIGRVEGNIYYAHGFSGHGVIMTHTAAQVIAEAIGGVATKMDVFGRLPHPAFPGGRLFRRPALVLAMLWARLRDMM